jgi:hypothetical protein
MKRHGNQRARHSAAAPTVRNYRNRFGQFALNARANFRGFKKIHK